MYTSIYLRLDVISINSNPISLITRIQRSQVIQVIILYFYLKWRIVLFRYLNKKFIISIYYI
jgi:hypothetical protein